MSSRGARTIGLLALAGVVGWPAAPARGQAAPPAPPPPAPAEPAPTGEPPPAVPAEPPPEMGDTQQPPAPQVDAAPATVFAAPTANLATVRRKRRTKTLQTTVGLQPTAPDFGGEADLISTADDESINVRPKKWTYTLKGFLRAPMRIGIGPNSDGTPAHELHSPARIAGSSPDDWNYVGLAPLPQASLYLTVANANVSGTAIIGANTLYDSGYKDLVNMGGFSQAYVTLRLPDLFAGRGGLSWTVGAFSNRYGNAGPRNMSTGYYNTSLFGRTHVSGETLTADFDLTDDLELVVEHGIGAKLEVVPFTKTNIPVAPYLPDQGPVPQGSNFVHHAHAALLVGEWMKVAAHYLTSWTPNDLCGLGTQPGCMTRPAQEGRLTVFGGEVHADHARFGSGYVGYSHIKATSIFPLSDGVQVLHGANGFGFKQNYFGPLDVSAGVAAPHNDSGNVDSVLLQYTVHFAPLFGRPIGPDAALALFAMYNHVTFDATATGTGGVSKIKQDKIKFGAELEAAPLRYFWVGARFDRVQPDGGTAEVAYSALSPRAIFHTSWMTKEYFILSYTHYFLGSQVRSSPIYQSSPISAGVIAPINAYVPDKDMVMLSAVVSF